VFNDECVLIGPIGDFTQLTMRIKLRGDGTVKGLTKGGKKWLRYLRNSLLQAMANQ
jgi:hypothetical protein